MSPAHQDWSEFVLADLGIYQYETIAFPPEARGFQSRRDVDDYLALQACRDAFDLLGSTTSDQETFVQATRDLLPKIHQIQIDNAWIARRRHKLLFQMIQI